MILSFIHFVVNLPTGQKQQMYQITCLHVKGTKSLTALNVLRNCYLFELHDIYQSYTTVKIRFERR